MEVRAWLARVLRVRPQCVFLPLAPRTTTKLYLEACQRLIETADGKVFVTALREKYFEALGARCRAKSQAERSEWLAAHEALLSVYQQLVDDLLKNVELLPPEPTKRKLRGVP